MKYPLFTLVLTLFLASCDSIDQPAVSEETVDFANQTDRPAFLEKRRKEKVSTCPCWKDVAYFETAVIGTVTPTSWSYFKNHRTTEAVVKFKLATLASSSKIGKGNYCSAGSDPATISSSERTACTNILVEWSETHLNACTHNIVGGRDLC